MPGSAAKASHAPALEMRLSVPSDGDFSAVAADLAAKVAEFLGGEAGSIRARLEHLASEVAAAGQDISFEFRHIGSELVIQARCNARLSEVRHPLRA